MRFNQLSDQYFDPLTGGFLIDGFIKLEVSGGGTDKDTFADIDQKIKNANPVPLSAIGVPPNIFFNGEAKAFLLRNNLTQIRVLDPVPGGSVATDAFADFSALITYAREDIARGSDERYYISITNNNIDNDPVTTTGFWMEFGFINFWDTAYTFQNRYIALASDGNLYRSLTADNQGNDPVSSPSKWALLTLDPNDLGTITIDGLKLNDTSKDHQYIWVVSELTDNRTVTWPLLIGNDTLVFETHIQTLVGKSLTTPTITGSPTAAGATWADLGTITTADINGGTIDGTNIGASVVGTGVFSALSSTSAADFSAAGLVFDNETLDTYDEGTFTPVLSDGTNNATSNVSVGRYTKIGNRVLFQLRIKLSSLDSVTGPIRITGLPFTSVNVSNAFNSIAIGHGDGLAITAGVSPAGYVEVNATHIIVTKFNLTTGITGFQASEVTDDGSFMIAGAYEAA